MAINGDEQLVAVCPQNPAHDRFLTTAHVMQEWEVEPNGEFTKVTEDCLQRAQVAALVNVCDGERVS